MDNNCLISFIIPLYNLQNWIIPCLDSIFRQQVLDNAFEVIVWDDGSIDNSANIVKNYALDHPQIKFISQENHGVSYVRNHAIGEARGQYLWFVDGDDEVNSKNIKSIVKKAVDFDLDLLLFNWKPINTEGEQENIILHRVATSSVIPGRNLYMHNMISMAPWCFIYRRDFLIENKLVFPEDFRTCEDIQFNQKVLWHAKRTMSYDLVGYFYRKMETSATQGNSARLVNDQIRRIPIEIDYFSEFSDWEYLTVVLYRNLREINVWIDIDKSNDSVYEKLSEILAKNKIKVRPLVSFMSLYIFLMKVSPRLISNIQGFAKKIKLLLR